jgi:hypothetical protein
MSRWVLHDAENCITDMLWTQATHKLPHVFLSKQAVIIHHSSLFLLFFSVAAPQHCAV